MTLPNTLELTKELVERKSLTPEDAGCQQLIAGLLANANFKNEHLRFENVDNLWSIHGKGSPVFCFLGHTDVVPVGPECLWKYPPFQATEKDGFLHGRGSADMKGCIAAFMKAAISFVQEHPDHKGSLAVLLTSDEEGNAINGTVQVIEELEKRNVKIDYCLVGEPSSEENLGDVIKIGRRGSLTGFLTVKGIQGHVAYPQLASNPIHNFAPALNELCAKVWDNGNEFFPATTFQISNLRAGTGVDNVIPGQLEMTFNFRYSTELDADSLKGLVAEILNKHGVRHEILWRLSGLPFLTKSGTLVDAVSAAVESECSYKPALSTAGGTSDGRFVAPTGAEVVELGLINRTIHKIDEHIEIAHLERLSVIYKKILETILL